MSNPYFFSLHRLIRNKGFFLFFGIPLLTTICYLFFLSADLYQATSQFIIKQNSSDNSGAVLDLGFLKPPTSTSHEDAFLLKEFIHSPDLLQILDQEADLRNHYTSPRLDFSKRLSKTASKEDFLDYYRKMISVAIKPDSNIVSIKALGFDREIAHKTVNLILDNSESFINRISKRLAEEQVNFVREEVTSAEARLRTAKEKILIFQNQKTLLSPESSIESKIKVVAEMQAEITEKKTELRALRGFLQDNAFQITSLYNQIDALEEQIEEEMNQLTGASKVSLNQIVAEFQNLSLDLEFAEKTYKSAVTSLETSRLEASRKLKHMVIISSSGLPDEPKYPQKLYNIFTALVVLILVYGIGRLIIATINDHRE